MCITIIISIKSNTILEGAHLNRNINIFILLLSQNRINNNAIIVNIMAIRHFLVLSIIINIILW